MTQRAGKLKKSFGAALCGDENTILADQFEDGDNLSTAGKVIGSDGDRRVVETHPLSVGQIRHVELRRHRHTHTLATAHDLDLTRRWESTHKSRQRLRGTRYVGQLPLQADQLGARCCERARQASVLLFQGDQTSLQRLAISSLTHR